MSITVQSRSATAESENSGMTNGRISVTNIVGVLRGGGDVHASLFIDNFPLWCGTLPMMCLLGLVLKVPNEVFCLCLMIEYIIKSPLGLYRLHSGKWIHDITRIE